MTVAVLCLEIVFLILALGWRAALQRRRTGDWGIRRPSTATAGVASVLMIGGFVLGGLAPIAQMGDVARFESLEFVPLRVGGLALVVVAIGGTLHAQLTPGASWRVGVHPTETTRLVTTGQFRLVRHPIFTWMVIASAGVALTVPNTPAGVGFGLVLCGVQLQARRVEEPHLLRSHDGAYRQYASRTGRFVPGIGRILPAAVHHQRDDAAGDRPHHDMPPSSDAS